MREYQQQRFTSVANYESILRTSSLDDEAVILGVDGVSDCAFDVLAMDGTDPINPAGQSTGDAQVEAHDQSQANEAQAEASRKPNHGDD